MICYPYYPSKDTGRGHDRYIFELARNIADGRSDIKVRLLHQGLSTGIIAAGMKLFRLLADLLHAKEDIYHAISPMGGAAAVLMGKFPLIVTIHDLIPFNVSGYDYSWKYWFIRQCVNLCVKRCDAVVVPYNVTKDELVSRFSVPASKIYITNHGVDHTTFYPCPSTVRTPGQVLYIGEVCRSKGVDSLIRAFSIVKQSVGEAELLIGGKRNIDQPMLEKLACDLGLKEVTFLGYVPENELPRYYTSAAVMIFPSRYGFGLSTLEAMACATPVIVGAVLDAPEFLADAGILVNPDDIDEIAESILRVLKDPLLREQLSAKATERAKAFTWGKMAGETVKVYHDMLAKKAARDASN